MDGSPRGGCYHALHGGSNLGVLLRRSPAPLDVAGREIAGLRAFGACRDLGPARPGHEAIVRSPERESRRDTNVAAEAREREQEIAELVLGRRAVAAGDG